MVLKYGISSITTFTTLADGTIAGERQDCSEDRNSTGKRSLGWAEVVQIKADLGRKT